MMADNGKNHPGVVTREQARYMGFSSDTAIGKFTAIVRLEDGMSDRDAREDAISMMQSAFGRAVRVSNVARHLAALPEDAWEEKSCAGWGWMAKGYLPDPDAATETESIPMSITSPARFASADLLAVAEGRMSFEEYERQCGGARTPEVSMKWIKLTDRMPDPDEHERVLIYTEGVDFNGEQVFDVKVETLNECFYADPEDQPEVCKHASHWAAHPRVGHAIEQSFSGNDQDDDCGPGMLLTAGLAAHRVSASPVRIGNMEQPMKDNEDEIVRKKLAVLTPAQRDWIMVLHEETHRPRNFGGRSPGATISTRTVSLPQALELNERLHELAAQHFVLANIDDERGLSEKQVQAREAIEQQITGLLDGVPNVKGPYFLYDPHGATVGVEFESGRADSITGCYKVPLCPKRVKALGDEPFWDYPAKTEYVALTVDEMGNDQDDDCGPGMR